MSTERSDRVFVGSLNEWLGPSKSDGIDTKLYDFQIWSQDRWANGLTTVSVPEVWAWSPPAAAGAGSGE